MSVETFVLSLAALLAVLFIWSFRNLPHARWQVLAVVPVGPGREERYRGANLTWYGLFNAAAASLAAAVFILLLAALGAPGRVIALLGAGVLAVGYGASRGIARFVEGKKHTASVGAAVFAVLAALPFLSLLARVLVPAAEEVDLLAVLAAAATAYALGEGLGRLACISFGCCYGRPVADLGPRLRGVFERLHFIFRGSTKKIAYASDLEGVPVVPIQALTAVVLTALGLAGLWLFLAGHPRAALVVTLSLSQLWRVLSETLRSDERGSGRLSAYQWMALALVPLGAALALLLPAPAVHETDLGAGLALLWSPGVILLLQGLALVVFLMTGWSKVTGALVSLRVYRSRI